MVSCPYFRNDSEAGRRRQPDALGQINVPGPALVLQMIENGVIDRV